MSVSHSEKGFIVYLPGQHPRGSRVCVIKKTLACAHMCARTGHGDKTTMLCPSSHSSNMDHFKLLVNFTGYKSECFENVTVL